MGRGRLHVTLPKPPGDDRAAREAVSGLCDGLRAGESLALVCFENTDAKRCHRTILRDRLRETLADDE